MIRIAFIFFDIHSINDKVCNSCRGYRRVDKALDNSHSISSPIIEEIRSNSSPNSYSSNFESNSPSSCSLSLNSNTTTPKELSVLKRVGKIRKEHNLSNEELTDTSINRSTKLSQHDLLSRLISKTLMTSMMVSKTTPPIMWVLLSQKKVSSIRWIHRNHKQLWKAFKT